MKRKLLIISILILVLITGCKSNANTSSDNREYVVNKKISDNEKIEDVFQELITSKIDKNFKIDDYIIQTATSNYEDDSTEIYDLYFKIGEVRTNIGYTIFVENNKVTSIYNNLGNYNTESLKKKKDIINKKVAKLTDKEKEKIKEKVLSNYDNRTIDRDEIIYIVEEDAVYYMITYIDVDEGNALSMDSYFEKL